MFPGGRIAPAPPQAAGLLQCPNFYCGHFLILQMGGRSPPCTPVSYNYTSPHLLTCPHVASSANLGRYTAQLLLHLTQCVNFVH